MKKGVLIEMNQAILIECDNCDYFIPNETGDPNVDTTSYINAPCPKCGANLLTQQDHDQAEKIVRIINRINKWFGWISYLIPKSMQKESASSVKVHDGVHVKTQQP